MNDVVIKATGLKKSYRMSKTNIVRALNGVDVEIRRGDFVAIVGPSGCGKSTLLHSLGLLDQVDEGTLSIEGVETSKMDEKQATRFRAKKIGFVFQGFNLIPTLSALENVMLAGKYGGLSLAERTKKAEKLLTEMGLADRMRHSPNELSGGQQQRVALARALINDPAIILADEPTGELDTTTSREIMEMLQQLNREQHRTLVIVTHNAEVAEQCKSMIRMRDGRNVSG